MPRAVTSQKADELEALLVEQARISGRRSLLSFIKYTRAHYRSNWHHEVICSLLDRMVSGELNRVIIQAPPRHGKSEIGSRAFPAFWLGRNPDATVMAASYSAALASKMNRDVQRIIDSPAYRELFPGVKLNDDNVRSMAGSWLRNSDEFEIVGRRGSYRSVGIGGGATGFGGNLIVIDDPVKNLEDAYSVTKRETAWNWYTSTILTREEDDLDDIRSTSAIMMILTRWHEDDLAGRALATMAASPDADRWHLCNLPAIKDGPPSEMDPRPLGEALWPRRRDVPRLKRIKATVTPIVWNALYQGRPSAPEGGIFKRQWWRFHYPESVREPPPVVVKLDDGTSVACVQKPLPKLRAFGQSWDFAFKDTKASAFVVGQAWGYEGANDYLIDQIRDRKDFNASVAALRLLSERNPRTSSKLVEDKANGAGIINTLQDEIPGILPINPEGSKEARAHAASHYVKAGNVWLPHPYTAPWVKDLIEELATFPGSAFKDQVDSLAQWLIWRHGDGSSIIRKITKM